MRANIFGGLIAAVVLSVGCGGTEPSVEEPSDLPEAEVSAMFVACGYRNYDVTYYAEAAHITVVGSGYCRCGELLQVTGSSSSYSVVREYPRCTILP